MEPFIPKSSLDSQSSEVELPSSKVRLLLPNQVAAALQYIFREPDSALAELVITEAFDYHREELGKQVRGELSEDYERQVRLDFKVSPRGSLDKLHLLYNLPAILSSRTDAEQQLGIPMLGLWLSEAFSIEINGAALTEKEKVLTICLVMLDICSRPELSNDYQTVAKTLVGNNILNETEKRTLEEVLIDIGSKSRMFSKQISPILGNIDEFCNQYSFAFLSDQAENYYRSTQDEVADLSFNRIAVEAGRSQMNLIKVRIAASILSPSAEPPNMYWLSADVLVAECIEQKGRVHISRRLEGFLINDKLPFVESVIRIGHRYGITDIYAYNTTILDSISEENKNERRSQADLIKDLSNYFSLTRAESPTDLATYMQVSENMEQSKKIMDGLQFLWNLKEELGLNLHFNNMIPPRENKSTITFSGQFDPRIPGHVLNVRDAVDYDLSDEHHGDDLIACAASQVGQAEGIGRHEVTGLIRGSYNAIGLKYNEELPYADMFGVLFLHKPTKPPETEVPEESVDDTIDTPLVLR